MSCEEETVRAANAKVKLLADRTWQGDNPDAYIRANTELWSRIKETKEQEEKREKEKIRQKQRIKKKKVNPAKANVKPESNFYFEDYNHNHNYAEYSAYELNGSNEVRQPFPVFLPPDPTKTWESVGPYPPYPPYSFSYPNPIYIPPCPYPHYFPYSGPIPHYQSYPKSHSTRQERTYSYWETNAPAEDFFKRQDSEHEDARNLIQFLEETFSTQHTTNSEPQDSNHHSACHMLPHSTPKEQSKSVSPVYEESTTEEEWRNYLKCKPKRKSNPDPNFTEPAITYEELVLKRRLDSKSVKQLWDTPKPKTISKFSSSQSSPESVAYSSPKSTPRSISYLSPEMLSSQSTAHSSPLPITHSQSFSRSSPELTQSTTHSTLESISKASPKSGRRLSPQSVRYSSLQSSPEVNTSPELVSQSFVQSPSHSNTNSSSESASPSSHDQSDTPIQPPTHPQTYLEATLKSLTLNPQAQKPAQQPIQKPVSTTPVTTGTTTATTTFTTFSSLPLKLNSASNFRSWLSNSTSTSEQTVNLNTLVSKGKTKPLNSLHAAEPIVIPTPPPVPTPAPVSDAEESKPTRRLYSTVLRSTPSNPQNIVKPVAATAVNSTELDKLEREAIEQYTPSTENLTNDKSSEDSIIAAKFRELEELAMEQYNSLTKSGTKMTRK